MRLVSVCLFLLSIHPLLATNEEWSGFWRLKQESERAKEILHLWVSAGGELRLYGSNWEVVQLDTKRTELGEQSLKLSQNVKGGWVSWSATRQDETLTGTWKFQHPQLLMEGVISGSQISQTALKRWSPLRAAHATLSAERVLNLAGLVKEEATSQSDFERYWRNDFVPGYLAFLPDLPDTPQAYAMAKDTATLKGAQDFDGIVTELLPCEAVENLVGIGMRGDLMTGRIHLA